MRCARCCGCDPRAAAADWWLLEPPSPEPPLLAFGPVHTASSPVSRLERSVLLQLLGSEAAVGRGGAGQAPAVPRAASVRAPASAATRVVSLPRGTCASGVRRAMQRTG